MSDNTGVSKPQALADLYFKTITELAEAKAGPNAAYYMSGYMNSLLVKIATDKQMAKYLEDDIKFMKMVLDS